jgi:hypothetical protein
MFCYQSVCNWPTQYCQGEVQKDLRGQWGCLGVCKDRVMKYYSDRPCNCTTASMATDYDTQDGSGNCVVGARVYPEVYYSQDNTGTWNTRQYWNSEAELQDTVAQGYGDGYMRVPFNNTRGIEDASMRFLTTDCPTMQPIAIWNSSVAAPGTPFPGTNNAAVQMLFPLSCACSADDEWWVPRTPIP